MLAFIRLYFGVTEIDQSGISKIENGQRPVTDIEVAALAKALKVLVEWLLEEVKK